MIVMMFKKKQKLAKPYLILYNKSGEVVDTYDALTIYINKKDLCTMYRDIQSCANVVVDYIVNRFEPLSKVEVNKVDFRGKDRLEKVDKDYEWKCDYVYKPLIGIINSCLSTKNLIMSQLIKEVTNMWINNKWVEWKDEDKEPKTKKENSQDSTAIDNCGIAIDTYTIISNVKVSCHRLNKTEYFDDKCRDLLIDLAKDRIGNHFKNFDKDINIIANSIFEILKSNCKSPEQVVDSITILYTVTQVPGIHFTLLDIKHMFKTIETMVNNSLKKYAGITEGDKDHPISKDSDVAKYIKLYGVFKNNRKSPNSMSSTRFEVYKYSNDIENEKMVEEINNCANSIIKYVEGINANIADHEYLISHVSLTGVYPCTDNTKQIICKIQGIVNKDLKRFSPEFYYKSDEDKALVKLVDNKKEDTPKTKFPYDETPLPANDDGKEYRLCNFKVTFYKNQPIVDNSGDQCMEFSDVNISCYIDKGVITEQTHKSANYIAMAMKYYLLKNNIKVYKLSVLQKEDTEFVKLVISKLNSNKEFTV